MTQALSQKAGDLVLRLLEASNLHITGAMLFGHYAEEGRELVAGGFLVPAGHEAAVAAEDDVPVAVAPEAGREVGFYDPSRGWTAVDPRLLDRFVLDPQQVFQALLRNCDLRLPRGSALPVESGVYDLGTIRVRKRDRTGLWFAGAIGRTGRWEALRDVLGRRPSASQRVVLTSCPHDQLPATELRGALLVAVDDVLFSSDPFAVDPVVLAARMEHPGTSEIAGPIHLTPDGRRLTINGSTQLRFRGEIQIALIRILVDAHENGRCVRAEELLSLSGSKSSSLDQAFGRRWEELRQYLVSEGGLWRFKP